MTTERVSLYGLPIVKDRRTAVERVDPAWARRMFLRHALVDADWKGTHEFVQRNKEEVGAVVALEARVRRDLLVDDEALTAFFDARVPEHVTSARRFDRWWKKVRATEPSRLTYSWADLVEPEASGLDASGFPDVAPHGGLGFALHYLHDPRAELDGVTADVPLALLARAREARLDWQVPGRRAELVAALLRTLPKPLRQLASPAPEAALVLLAEMAPEDGPLLEVLATTMARVTGARVTASSFDPSAVPPHLLVTYRVLAEDGTALAWSKDLDALAQRLADQVREAVAKGAPIAEQTGLASWSFGDLPRTVEVQHGRQQVTAYPSLVDEGATVGVRVLASEAEQRRAMWGGTRRLVLLQLGAPLRALDRALPDASKRAIARSERVRAAEVYVESTEAAVDHLLLAAGGPVWTEAEFDALVAKVRPAFVATAREVGTVAGEVLATAERVDARLATMLAPAFDETVVDARSHLDRLLHRGWLASAGQERLPDVLRYVRALEHRLEKAVEQPDRDRARTASVRALEAEYRPLAARDRDGAVREQLEELRVATFAQPVGARGGASEQKVRRTLLELARG